MTEVCIKFFVGDTAYLSDLTPVVITKMTSLSGDTDYTVLQNGKTMRYDEECLFTYSEAADLLANELLEEIGEL